MYKEFLLKTNNFFKNIIDEQYLDYLQETLIQLKIYIKILDLISYISYMTFILFFILFLIIISYHLSYWVLLFSFIPIVSVVYYLIYKKQKRNDLIEEELPNYLLQLSTLLEAGMALESSFDEISKTSNGYLNDEIKRALIEIKLGNSFNDSFESIVNRCDSNNLKHVIWIIINSKENGGNLSEILQMISDDMRDMLILKKERKAGVMMSVMFLLISAVIATPFAFGTIEVYSTFLDSLGRSNLLLDVIPLVSNGYIIIHSILVGILISIVMYSNYKKSIKYIILLIPLSLGVYNFSKLIIRFILGV